MKLSLRFLIAILCIPVYASSLADVPSEQVAEVEHLLAFVGNSGCTVHRNGSDHSVPEAVKHIEMKYDYFRDDIGSTEDFIKYSATKSTMSGNYYQVSCPGKETVRTKDWLLKELQRFRMIQKTK